MKRFLVDHAVAVTLVVALLAAGAGWYVVREPDSWREAAPCEYYESPRLSSDGTELTITVERLDDKALEMRYEDPDVVLTAGEPGQVDLDIRSSYITRKGLLVDWSCTQMEQLFDLDGSTPMVIEMPTNVDGMWLSPPRDARPGHLGWLLAAGEAARPMESAPP